MLENFQPALATLTDADGHRDSHNYPLVQKVAEANARLTAASLLERSPTLKALVDSKQLKIAAAMHDITTGRVTRLSYYEVLRQLKCSTATSHMNVC